MMSICHQAVPIALMGACGKTLGLGLGSGSGSRLGLGLGSGLGLGLGSGLGLGLTQQQAWQVLADCEISSKSPPLQVSLPPESGGSKGTSTTTFKGR